MKYLILPILLFATFFSVAQTRTGRDYAVFFTVSNYDSIWPNLPQIPGEIAELELQLRNEYGFSVRVVSNATRKDIENTLTEYSNTKLYSSDSQLLLFFAMHGQRTTQGQGYLIPKEGTKSAATWLAYTQLSDIIDEMPCPRILVSIDACYSGAFGDNRSQPGGATWEIDNLDCSVKRKLAFENKMPARKYLTAGRAEQRVPGQSKFAKRWQTALASTGGEDGILSFAELWGHLYQLDGSGVLPTNGAFGRDRSGDFSFICKTCCGAPPDDGLVLVRGGTFMMGSMETNDEKPVHGVTISDFYISKHEVTVAQFKVFVEETKYQTDAEKENYSCKYTNRSEKLEGINWRFDAEGLPAKSTHPVIYVSWNDAIAYCEWLSRKTGKTYRLPTEAEWEYAAGNGIKHTRYSWGNSEPVSRKGGNVADESSTARNGYDWEKKFENYTDDYWLTAPVGSYEPNDFGLYDMTGNVWEFCSDRYASDYYVRSPLVNPKGPGHGDLVIIRGGCWADNQSSSFVHNRNACKSNYRNNAIGFRLACNKEH